MGVPKITGFFIALILISAIAVTLSTFVSELAGSYSVSYDNTTFGKYEKIQKLSDDAKTIREDVSDVTASPNFFDRLEAFFASGYGAIKTTFDTVDTGLTISENLVEDLSPGEGDEYVNNNIMNTWKNSFIAIISVLFFTGIVVSIFVKRENI